MKRELSKLQKVTLLYIGVQSNKRNSTFVKRRDVTPGLFDILNKENKDTFSASLSTSIKSLKRRELVYKRARYIGLTKKGRQKAREIKQEIIDKYGEINWNIVGRYYEKEN